MRVLIVNVQVPFIQGGAEVHAENLCSAFNRVGHQAELVRLPFNDYPERMREQVAAFEGLDLRGSVGMPIDMIVCMKFPTYVIPHHNKVLWIPHQYRQAYDLWKHPLGGLDLFPKGEEIREFIVATDKRCIPLAQAVFTTSHNNSSRLERFCAISAKPLYHPPPLDKSFYCADAGDYLFVPSRVTPLKRHSLILKALSLTASPVKICFAGAPDSAACEREFSAALDNPAISGRVKWLGFISDEEKIKLYANSLGVVFVPYDEDYGYITLEAMLSSKPVITCTDSGGPLEFIIDQENGLIAEPNPESLAKAMDALWINRQQAGEFGLAGRARYEALNISWNEVIKNLTAHCT